MESNTQNRTIALAALFQCVEGVNQVANTGNVDASLYKTCLSSILKDNPKSAEDLYGSLEALKTGLKTMMYQLSSGQMTPDGKPKELESTRYALGLIHLGNNKLISSKIFINHKPRFVRGCFKPANT